MSFQRTEARAREREEGISGIAKAFAIGIAAVMMIVLFMSLMQTLIPTPKPPPYSQAEVEIVDVVGGD